MQAHVHQAVVLTAFGNEFLRNGTHTPAFWPNNAAFHYSKSVTFVEGMPKPDGSNAELCGDPLRWVTWLKANGIRGLRMAHSAINRPREDYNTVGFGGGGRWIIEALKASTSDLWQSASTIVDDGAPDEKSWANTYYRTFENWQQYPIEEFDLNLGREMLSTVLPKALSFAEQHRELSQFADFLAGGLKALNSEKPLMRDSTVDFDHCTLMPLAAKQIIGAVNHAWIFGGTNWWNDNGFADPELQRQYLAVTAELWETLARSLVYAANSTMPVETLAKVRRA